MWFYGKVIKKLLMNCSRMKQKHFDWEFSFGSNFSRHCHFNPHEIRQQIENFPSCQPEHRGRDDQR